MITCPLCADINISLFHQDQQREYHRCKACLLVFVLPQYFLSSEAEKAEYDLHQNSPEDHGYRRFLSRLFTPMEQRLSPNSEGLDFGSGPGPTLSVMLEEVGHTVQLYDHFYAQNPDAFTQSYDFITATEVVEHLHQPHQELNRLWACLRAGGYLGIMTKLVRDQAAFATWHYKNDLTHVCFFSHTTFECLAEVWQAMLHFEGADVIIFEKTVG
ncbi:MAG: class I SAM-dependent methyltransferase [Chloroflexota bacterium]